MDLVVFGDDWDAHPSTTQHLIMSMASTDRIVWVDSIGFRSPRLTTTDFKRLQEKTVAILKSKTKTERKAEERISTTQPCHFVRISPLVIPFHLNPLSRFFNSWSLKKSISAAMKKLGIKRPFWLSVTPVASQYLKVVPYRKLAYLRLDDYGDLPGVDPVLIEQTEKNMMEHSAAIFATAKKLLPEKWLKKSHYLPQGVETKHFARTSVQPSKKRILGFFGLIAEWLDFELIKEVALTADGWTLEFVGPVRYRPGELEKISNILWKPAVSFHDLPETVADWTCAWIPFEVSKLTEAVNPLKVREYLAAGIATHCTPLPEVEALRDRADILISSEPGEIACWLETSLDIDSPERRLARRESVAGDSWSQRAQTVRDIFTSEAAQP